MTPDIAKKLLLIRDALIRDDGEEAYHQLCKIADPELENLNHWQELEKQAASQPPLREKPDFDKIVREVYKKYGFPDTAGKRAIEVRLALCERIWRDYLQEPTAKPDSELLLLLKDSYEILHRAKLLIGHDIEGVDRFLIEMDNNQIELQVMIKKYSSLPKEK
jgi:hypothetical protein